VWEGGGCEAPPYPDYDQAILAFEEDKGCVLSYWRGGPKGDILADEYWNNLENTFKRADELVEKAYSNLLASTNAM
jgi:hypothetical protein